MKKKVLVLMILLAFVFAFAGCHGNQTASTDTTTTTVKSALLTTADEFGKAQKKAIDKINEIVAAAAKVNLIRVEQEKKYMEIQHKVVKAQILYAGILDKIEAGSMSSLNILSASAEFISVLVQSIDLVESFGVEIPSDLKAIKNGLSRATS